MSGVAEPSAGRWLRGGSGAAGKGQPRARVSQRRGLGLAPEGCGWVPTGDAEKLGEEEGRESSRYGWGVRLDAPRGPRGFSLKLQNVDVVAPLGMDALWNHRATSPRVRSGCASACVGWRFPPGNATLCFLLPLQQVASGVIT